MRPGMAVISVFFMMVLSVVNTGASITEPDILTRTERAWLAEHSGKITIAPDPSDPPLDFLTIPVGTTA